MEEIRDNLVYDRFIIPVKLHYYGYTDDIDNRRQYKTTALQYYIDQYGWDNINTTIVTEGLTKREAELLENKLIIEGWERGDCINKQRSGGVCRDNPKEYIKKYYQDNKDEISRKRKIYEGEHKDEISKRQKKYREEHKEEIQNLRKCYYDSNKEELLSKSNDYYKEHKENRLDYAKQRNSTSEGKIYTRVNAFNRDHPERKLITPLEAKEMYILTGYIPNFIKNDDLY